VKGRRQRMRQKEVKIACCTDDAITIFKDNLQRLHKFDLTMEKYNMIIFVQKIQTVVIAKEPKRKLAVYNKNVDHVMTFKYLETNITSNKNLEEVSTKHS
jgi:hypothetical protein